MNLDFKDSANSKKINLLQKIKSFFYLKYHKVIFGKNTYVKKNFEIRKTEESIIQIGSNCIIQEYTFFLLTKPNPKLTIGNNVSIGRNSILAIKDHLKIGNNTEIAANVSIYDQSHGIEKNKLINEQFSLVKKVTIGDDVWIGAGTTILKGVKIGNGAVIGANSLVNKNIPDNQIWAGNPVKYLKER
tara:strand:+ start:8813 stop:9373 length:561 start_codon:yes stop_codon:yes gene_type:complete